MEINCLCTVDPRPSAHADTRGTRAGNIRAGYLLPAFPSQTKDHESDDPAEWPIALFISTPAHQDPRGSVMVSSRNKRAAAEDTGEVGSPRPTPSSERTSKKPKPDGPQRKKTSSDGSEKSATPKPKRSTANDKSRGAATVKRAKNGTTIEVVEEEDVAEPDGLPTKAVVEESPEVQKEQQAREKLFAEITDE